MHDAGLHPRGREGRLDRLGEALQAVDAADQDVLDAAAAQVVEDGQPELGALGLLPPDPEDLRRAVAGHAEREVAGAALDRAVLPDLHEHGVEVDDRIDAVQRPGAPRGDVLQDGVGDAADRVAPDVDAVELGQVGADVADGHAAGVEAQDLVVQARQPGLALGHELGVEAAVTIARRADLDRPQVGRNDLAPGAVADVRALRHAARRMAEMLGQLGAQRGLDHAARELGQQPARAGDVVGLKAVQRVLERLRRQQTGEPVDHGIRRTLRSVDALRRISLRIRDGLNGHRCPSRPQGPNRSPRPHTLHRTDPDELIARVARAGARGPTLLRADSAFWNKKLIARLDRAGWRYSI